MQGVELRHLRCLVAIAEEGSFSRAALRLGTTQPAISQLLKRLEDMLGHRLLERDRSPPRLTPLGETVLREARQALGAVEEAMEATRRGLRGEVGRLRIGVSVPSLYSGTPALIRRFRSLRPEVVVEMRVLPSQDQPEALLERRIDLAFGTFTESPPGLVRHLLADEAMCIALPAWHRLAGAERLTLAMLREEAWILPPHGIPLRQEILLHCHAAGFTPRVAAESADFLNSFALIMADAGIALAAESFRRFTGPDVVLAPIEGPAPRLLHHLNARLADTTPTVAAFLAMALRPG